MTCIEVTLSTGTETPTSDKSIRQKFPKKINKKIGSVQVLKLKGRVGDDD